MPQLPRKPKSQFEISNLEKSDIFGNDLSGEKKHNRALDVRRDNDNVKNFTVKLVDIDTALLYYLENTVLPMVNENGESFKPPVIYGSPERWKTVQEDGYYKDKDGKIQVPLVMFRRSSMTKNRNLTNKVDANDPHLYQTFTKRWSRKNAYNHFNLVNNISPALEQYNVVVPDYVDIVYECVVWTDFVQQMNDIIEAINYAEGSYWGEPERFKFRVRVDDFTNIVELTDNADRLVRTTFNINLAGYIIPDSLNAAIANKTSKAYTNFIVRFSQEVESTIDTTDIAGQGFRTNDGSIGGSVQDQGTSLINQALPVEIVSYLSLNITKNSDDIQNGDTAIFYDAIIAAAPAGLPATSKDNFMIFVNGQLATSAMIISINQVGSTTEIVFDTATLGFTLDSSTDKVIAIGKFNSPSDTTV